MLMQTTAWNSVYMNTDVITHIGLYSGIDERLALGIPPRPLQRNVDFDEKLSQWHRYRYVPTETNTVYLNNRMFADLSDLDADSTSLWTQLCIYYRNGTQSAFTYFRMVTTLGFKSGDIDSIFDTKIDYECPIPYFDSIEQTFKNGRWELVISPLERDLRHDKIMRLREWANKRYGLV
jgi:hypothetical protein